MSASSLHLRLGTRGSPLALWQAHHIRDRLLGLGVASVELEIIKTTGDRIQDVALSQVGGKGLFVKEIEEALQSGRVDLAVHSMKDVPSERAEGLIIAAIPEREDPRDALVLPADVSPSVDPIADLPQGGVVGTSSLRRGAQLLALRPDLKLIALRGNVDTRLRKLDTRENGLCAIILASAGLRRLGLAHRISYAIPTEVMLPAVGQGALAIEARAQDEVLLALLAQLNDGETRAATLAERALLKALEGNCQVPIAGFATLEGEVLHLKGRFAASPEAPMQEASASGPAHAAEVLGEEVAALLRAKTQA